MTSAAPLIIIQEDNSYKIDIKFDKEKKLITIAYNITSTINNFYYEKSLEFDEFIHINKIFRIFEDINEIYNFLDENLKEDKISIEKDKNYEYINIIFNVFNLKGNVEKIKIQLNKKEYAQDIKFKKIMNHINDLIKENNNLKSKLEQAQNELNFLRNIIYHKMDSLIIENKEEQLFLENRLKKINIFSNKILLSRLLFRSSIHGDNAQTFHRLCDYKNNLLFLIKTTKNLRFGGFTTNMITPICDCIKDDEAFCFSLSLKKIYNKIKKFHHSLYLHTNEIITFLMDIFKVYDNFFKAYSICTDSRDIGKYVYFDNQEKPFEINGGEKNFLIKELEVFEIIYI